MTTTVSLLTDARALFTDEAHWYRGTSTPDPDDDQRLHCPITAITTVGKRDDVSYQERIDQRRAALVYLHEELPFKLKAKPGSYDASGELIVWNDERATFADVLELFDRAIARAEADA